MIDFSIIILIYNADWNKLRGTINSVLIQKNVEYEIIISDDGSKEDISIQIKNFFQERNFSRYKICINKFNQGTAKNALCGLEMSTGKWVKMISPGDFLYDEFTLYNSKKFIENNKADIYFGKAAYYSLDGDAVQLYSISNPNDLWPYLKQSKKQIKRNYLLRLDYILGACFIVDRDKFIYYLKELINVIKYCEDCTVIYMIANNENIMLIDKFIETPFIWYEYGSGISTNKNDKWTRIIRNENIKVFKLLLKKQLISKLMYNSVFGKNKVLKYLSKSIVDSEWIIKRLFHLDLHYDVEFTDVDIQKLSTILN